MSMVMLIRSTGSPRAAIHCTPPSLCPTKCRRASSFPLFHHFSSTSNATVRSSRLLHFTTHCLYDPRSFSKVSHPTSLHDLPPLPMRTPTFWVFFLVSVAQLACAHISPYVLSMYGINNINPFGPIGPWWSFDDWWMRGAPTRHAPPPKGEISSLPAGGMLMLELACHIAWTTLGCCAPTPPVACPNNNGAYHAVGDSQDPMGPLDLNLIAGCALAIADTTDIDAVTVDNLAIFSVQKNCVLTRDTYFSIPAKMPPCTGAYCICTWMWEPQNGTANFYMTPFHCRVDGSPIDATPILMPLKDPLYCPDGGCVTGAKRPIYVYNNDYANIARDSDGFLNDHRPGYHSSWSFNDGAQNDIFMTATEAAVYVAPSPNNTLSKRAVASAPAVDLWATDLALQAVATASSFSPGQPPSAANDRNINGYKADGTGNSSAEWASNGELAGAWLLLTWPLPVSIKTVIMYDRPNWSDFCKAGTLTFGDGHVVQFGELDNGGGRLIVNFPSRSTKTLLWTCTQVSAWTVSVGLSEIRVYGSATTSNSNVVLTNGTSTVSSSAYKTSSSSSSSRTSLALSSSTTRTSPSSPLTSSQSLSISSPVGTKPTTSNSSSSTVSQPSSPPSATSSSNVKSQATSASPKSTISTTKSVRSTTPATSSTPKSSSTPFTDTTTRASSSAVKSSSTKSTLKSSTTVASQTLGHTSASQSSSTLAKTTVSASIATTKSTSASTATSFQTASRSTTASSSSTSSSSAKFSSSTTKPSYSSSPPSPKSTAIKAKRSIENHPRDWTAREAISARQAEERRRELMADTAHQRPADF